MRYGDVTGRKLRTGPTIALASLILAPAIGITMILVDGFKIPTLMAELTVLTRVSSLIFILIFIARPLHDLLGTKWTAWLVANRRYLGLSFAAWHLMHWPILASVLAIEGPATFWKYTHSYLIPATTVLLVITFMAATSSDRAVRWLGKPLWSTLHTIGLYLIWGWMVRNYIVMMHRHELHLYVHFALLCAAMVFRLAMAVRRTLRRPTSA
jgi:sulfoxide reductase heme-binding subunit YedZ